MNLKLVLWAIIGVLVLYVAWQAWRLMAASRPGAQAAREDAPSPREPAAPALTDEAGVTDDDEDDGLVYQRPRATPAPAPAPAPANEGAVFQLELQVRQLQRELAQLRAAHQELASELAAVGARLEDELRDGLHALSDRIDQAPVATTILAPQYDEAMVFARRGLDPAAIAERCEISIGEAELVCSLARRGGGAVR